MLDRLPNLALGAVAVLLVACGGKLPQSEATPEPPHPPIDVPPADAGSYVEAVDGSGGPGFDAADLDKGKPSSTYPVAHPLMANVLPGSGNVIRSPKFVLVTFDGDPFRAEIEAFASKLGQSDFWAATTAEYGVEGSAFSGQVHVTESAPTLIDDVSIQRWLRTRLDGSQTGWPAPDDSTVYALYYPPGTTISLQGYLSCDVFGGYHSELKVGERSVPYVVIPRCASFTSVHGFDVVTVASSHEFIEVVTDPYPFTDPAYSQADPDHVIWGIFTGGELGDMCTYNEGSFFAPPGLSYTVQRSWSNASAAGGHDPCVPALPREIYFNSAPVLPDTVNLQGRVTKGVKIPLGEKRVIDLVLYSDGPTHPWKVSATDLSALWGGPRVLNFAFDRTTGVNGERLHMEIEPLATDGQFGGEGFVVISELEGQKSYWYGFVEN